MIQKTYILDTNVYGELLIEVDSQQLIKNVKDDSATYVYGLDIIENELKNSPVDVKHKGKLLRDTILGIYKTIIDEQILLFPVAEHLASEYFKKFDVLRKSVKYRGIAGRKVKKYSEDDLMTDFQIIAVASIKSVDIVVSTDKRTILSNIAEDTYKTINKSNGFRTPALVKYSDFKRRYIR